MKKRMLSVLLAALMVCTVLLPLANVASAASQPRLRMLHNNSGENAYLEMGLDEITYTGVKVTSVDTKNKTVFVSFDNVQSDTFAFYFVMPNADWTLFVGLKGTSKLPVKYNELTKSWMGLGTNGSLLVYAQIGGSALYVTGEYGKSKAAALNEDYYGLYGDSIAVGNGSDTINLWVSFDLNLTGLAKQVYPFRTTGKNTEATLNGANFFYNLHSTHVFGLSETPILLAGNSYLYTSSVCDNAPSGNAAPYWVLKYSDSFAGLVHIESKNGYYYGGAYSSEGPVSLLGQRYIAKFDDTWKYHAVAKNYKISMLSIPWDAMRSAFSFPLAKGYVLPAQIDNQYFSATVKWTVGDDTADIAGTQADYGKLYKATVTLVPKAFYYVSDATYETDGLKALVPPRAYSVGQTVNPYNSAFRKSLFVRFNELVHPDTQITKQPVDATSYGTSRNMQFSVDTNDPSATYQWQIANSATGPWTDVKDYTKNSSTPITGAKTKVLNYNFGYYNTSDNVDFRADLKYLRCKISGYADGKAATLYSNVAKYEHAPTQIKKIVITNLDAPDGVHALDTTASTSTTGVSISKVSYAINNTGVTSAKPGDTVQINITVYVPSGYSIDPSTTVAQWNGMTSPKAYSGGTQYFLQTGANTYTCQFVYTIPVVLTKIRLNDVRMPYNGVGYVSELPNVTCDPDSRCYVGFKTGWHEGIGGSRSMPLIDNFYYLYLSLGADDGCEFSEDFSKYNITLYDLAGRKITPDDIYISNTRTRERKNDGLDLWIGFKCTETHIRKGNSIKDITMPAAGQKLDTDISFVSGNMELSFIDYAINGTFVKDYNKETPQPGDTVDIYVGAEHYSETFIYDDEIFCYWYVNGNDSSSVSITNRDWSYPVSPDICVFRLTWHVPEKNAEVTEIAFTRVTQPSKGQTVSSSAIPLHPEEIELLDDNGTWFYDEGPDMYGDIPSSTTFRADEYYVLRFRFRFREGYRIADSVQYALTDRYGGEVDYDHVESWRIGETYFAEFFIKGIAKHPEIPKPVVNQITVLNVPVLTPGEEVGSVVPEYAEPVKLKHTNGTFRLRTSTDGGETYTGVKSDEKIVAGQKYIFSFIVGANIHYTLGQQKDLKVLLISPEGKEIVPDEIKLEKITGIQGVGVVCYFTPEGDGGFMLGDVDNDTHITASDARLALRRAVDLETYTPDSREFKACDVDKDGSVTANDARSILRAAVDLEDPATW